VYAIYFWKQMSGEGERASGDDLGSLKLQPRKSSPDTWAVGAQTVATLVVIFAASHLFVKQLEWAGPVMGLSPVVVALLLSPVATELPEIMNTIIWVRQGKTKLALANISGAMMIQATVPSGIGLQAGRTTQLRPSGYGWLAEAPVDPLRGRRDRGGRPRRGDARAVNRPTRSSSPRQPSALRSWS
jgi:hypothetical protein